MMTITTNCSNYNPSARKTSFGAGNTSLFTDFDGTFLSQPLHDIYNGSDSQKKQAVNNYNKYFGEFQNFINNAKDKFKIIITTGRRLYGDKHEGFEHTYERMRKEGIVLPEIKAVITAEGGDIHHFKPDGAINRTPDPLKTEAIKNACGWDNEVIKNTLDNVAKQTGTDYKFTDTRGSYKLSVCVEDKSKIEEFYTTLNSLLKDKMQLESKITDIKIYTENGEYSVVKGIKLKPKIHGHSLHKDFDVKKALKRAIADNDFVIAAGDADNDKEMLNIFKYIDTPKGMKCPATYREITPEYANAVKKQIENLPIKIIFVKTKDTNPKTAALYDFVRITQIYFPDKISIIEASTPGGKNNLLNETKKAISEFAKNNKKFKTALMENKELLKELNFKLSKNNAKWIAFSVIATGAAICSVKKLQKNNSPKS